MTFHRLALAHLAYLTLFISSPCALLGKQADLGRITSTVAEVFTEGHYSHHAIDSEISARCLNAYLDKLDPDHLFFKRPDIEQLSKRYSEYFGKEVSAGKLDTAKAIYGLYTQRVRERLAKTEELLKHGKFDFASNRSMELSRENAPWPKDEAEADSLWRDQIEGDLLDGKLEGESLSDGIQSVHDRYDRLAGEVANHSQNQIMADVLSALAHAFDPHSEYLRRQDFDALNTDMRLSMVGIGITIETDGRFVKVGEVYPASPAGVDGRLKPNDRLLAVAHGDEGFISLEGKSFDQVLELIHAKKGTRIQLKVQSPGKGATRVIDLVSRTIELNDEQAKAEVIVKNVPSPAADSLLPGALPSRCARLGWLKIPSFYGDPENSKGRSVAKDVRDLLNWINSKKVEGVVLDMRGNPGGELEEAVKIGGLFLGKVPIVQEKDADGSIYVSKANTAAIYHGPLVVLVDHLTASAAELLAAALQDHGRAVIAGGHYPSFGKGTVQTVLELNELLPEVPKGDAFGAVQLTIAKFYRVNGASTQLKGLSPDLPLPSPEDLPGEGETAMKNPLAYDEAPPVQGIEPMAKKGFGLSRADLTTRLKLLSDARIKSDLEFRFLLEDLERAKANYNRVSLNEAVRRKELAEEKARTQARQAERDKQAPSHEKIIQFALGKGKPAFTRAIGRKAKAASEEEHSTQPDAVRNEALNIAADLAAITQPTSL